MKSLNETVGCEYKKSKLRRDERVKTSELRRAS